MHIKGLNNKDITPSTIIKGGDIIITVNKKSNKHIYLLATVNKRIQLVDLKNSCVGPYVENGNEHLTINHLAEKLELVGEYVVEYISEDEIELRRIGEDE